MELYILCCLLQVVVKNYLNNIKQRKQATTNKQTDGTVCTTVIRVNDLLKKREKIGIEAHFVKNGIESSIKV